jgi:hypothetical protein
LKRGVIEPIRVASILLLALALGLLATSMAEAAGRAPLVPATAIPVTDGRSVATWVDDGRLAVLRDSQPLAKPVFFPRPKDCVFSDDPNIPARYVVDGDRVVLVCYSAGESPLLTAVFGVYDYVTGRLEIPPSDALAQFESATNLGTGFEVIGLGSRWMEIEGCESHGCTTVLEDIQTGRLLDPSPEPAPAPRFASSVMSLDTASATLALCAPLRIGSHREPLQYGGFQRVTDYAVYRPPFLLTLRNGKAELQRCGSQRYETLGHATTILLTGRYAAWSNGKRLTVLGLRHHARFRYKLASAPYLVGTDCRLWVSPGAQTLVADYC